MTTAAGVVVVDAPPTIGHNILRAIATVTKSHVTHAIYSHHHADHAGAMVLYEGARFYAQSEAAGLLRQAKDPNRPLPHVTFDDQLTVQAGEDRVELAYHGPNHSPGNIFTYLPAQRVLGGPTSTPCQTPTNSLNHCGSTTVTSARSGSIPSHAGLGETTAR